MANETMKFLWGKNSKIPSSAVDGKAYFAVIDAGYTDSAAPTNEAFIYLDKDGNRYNVIAKRAIFDSLGNKITNKYFSETNNSGSNTIEFFTAEQNPSEDTPIKSATIITSIDLSNSSITANEYKIKTIINGFEDTRANTANSTLSLDMASEEFAGLISAEEQTIGGKKTFTGDIYFNNLDTTINTSAFDMSSANALLFAENNLKLQSNISIDVETNSLSIVSPVAINGNTFITGTLGVTGVTSISDETDATSSAGALKVTGGALISKKLYVKGVATFANTTDGSSSGGAVVVSGGVKIAKSLYIGNNLTVAQAISNSRNATFNGNAVTNSYNTTIWGYLYGKNDTTLSRNIVLNGDEPTEDTYTTTIKGITTFNKEVTIQDDLILNGDGVIGGDLSVRGGDIYLGAAGDYATISYSSGTVTISFPS